MSGLLMKGFSQTIEHETKEQRSGSLDLLLDTPGANIWQIYKSDQNRQWSTQLDRSFNGTTSFD